MFKSLYFVLHAEELKLFHKCHLIYPLGISARCLRYSTVTTDQETEQEKACGRL